MRRFTTLAAVFALLFLALAHSVAFGQQPPAPVVRYQFRVEGAPIAGPFDLVHQTLRFVPGASSPWHTHPGLLLVTIAEGGYTLRTRDAGEKVFKTGDSFVELPHHLVQAHNTTSENALALVSIVVPDGEALSTPEPGDTTPLPRPVVGWQGRADALPPPNPYDAVQWVLDFAPGAATPWHTHAGQLFVTVLEGEVTFNVNNVDRVYKAGESFVELPNEVARARNATGTRTSVLVTALLPKGAPLSHPVALPATGRDGRPMPVLALAAMLLLGGAAIRRRRQARR